MRVLSVMSWRVEGVVWGGVRRPTGGGGQSAIVSVTVVAVQ